MPPEAGAASPPAKPLQPSRRSKSISSRQVHFDTPPPPPSSSTPPPTKAPPQQQQEPTKTQPDSFPQVHNPLPYLNRPPSEQWYTAVDPTRSLNAQPAAQTTPFWPFSFLQPQPQPQPQVSYPVRTAMGDYQNCAPPPTGVNFQPPVPDSTYGTIPHVYVPRFDGPFQVGSFPSSAPPCLVSSGPPAPVGVMVYGYTTYYASFLLLWLCLCQSLLYQHAKTLKGQGSPHKRLLRSRESS